MTVHVLDTTSSLKTHGARERLGREDDALRSRCLLSVSSHERLKGGQAMGTTERAREQQTIFRVQPFSYCLSLRSDSVFTNRADGAPAMALAVMTKLRTVIPNS